MVQNKSYPEDVDRQQVPPQDSEMPPDLQEEVNILKKRVDVLDTALNKVVTQKIADVQEE